MHGTRVAAFTGVRAVQATLIALFPAAARAAAPTYAVEASAGDARWLAGGAEAACLRVETDRPARIRLSGEGAVTLQLRADLEGDASRLKFEVEVAGRPRTVRVRANRDASARYLDGPRASLSLPVSTQVHLGGADQTVEVRVAGGERGGGCVAVEGASRVAAFEAVSAAPAPPAPAAAPPAPPQTPAPGGVAPPPAAGAAEAAPAPLPAEPEPEEIEHGRLILRAGAIAGASDEAETVAARHGGWSAAAGLQLDPGWRATASILQARGAQQVVPATGSAVAADQTRTDVTATSEYRVWRDRGGLLGVWLGGGPRWLALQGRVTRPWMAGVLLGGRVEADVHEGLVIDAGGGWAHAILSRDDDGSALGGFKTTYLYTAGLSLRFAPRFRVRAGYLGEQWVFEHSRRTLHGGEVAVQARLF